MVSFAAAIFLTIFSSLIWLSGVVIVGAFLALIVKSAYFPPSSKSSTRLYESKPENQLPMQAIVDGEGFHFIKAQSRSDIAWPGILGVVSTHEVLAVLDQDKVAHCIPGRALTEDEATAFVAAIEEHLADASRATQDDGPQRALA